MALWKRRPAPGLIAHHDRGSQYASAHYRQTLTQQSFGLSMSRKGNGWDNGASRKGTYVQWESVPPGEKLSPCSTSGSGAGNSTVEAH